jgi:hypothetical protein
VLNGLAILSIKATQDLSSFNLDLTGLNVRWIKVNGVRTQFSRDGGELTVTPRHGLRNHTPFTVVVKYDGIPEPVEDSLGLSGFLATDDGALVVGQPHVAATWYPVNDHPLDTASYTYNITVPKGLEAIANGKLRDKHTEHGWTTWTWNASKPMASYLTTMTVGDFDLRAYEQDGLKFWDAVDPDLYDPVMFAHTGDQFALSQQASATFKRLTRTIHVPDVVGPTLSFWTIRDTEANWDHFFVEAHSPGADNWTTLPDTAGHTGNDTGFACPDWLTIYPFLAHYQTDSGDGSCSATGTSGAWNAISGSSVGYEQWTVDLTPYRNADVEISLSYASDPSIQLGGVAIDDIAVTGGDGTTSFEDDGDELDGWTVPGAPADSAAPNENDWIVGTVADSPPPLGLTIDHSFSRQKEILDFLGGYFGPYPFSAAGGIVDDLSGLGFALENQTRPIYAKDFFTDPIGGDAVVVHEYTHQWFGDNLPLGAWKDIWLNEGFATYAEWLWSEHEGTGTVQEIFDFYTGIPDDDPFWTLPIGDPGPDLLFEIPVYYRGGMTLHALRLQVGDHDFFKILKTWARTMAGHNVTTPQFIELAEHISGQQLDDFFDAWLYSPTKPATIAVAASASRIDAAQSVSPVAHRLMHRVGSPRH